jgi:hypothetical protein
MMGDEEFILYCETHSLTERAGFVPEHLARIHRLAGHEETARQWDAAPLNIISCDLRDLCREARQRMTQGEEKGR